MDSRSNSNEISLARLKALAPQPDDLVVLGNFSDENGHAVSFYYRPVESSHASYDSMLLNLRVRDIISNSFSVERRTSGLLRDLDHCLELAEQTPAEYQAMRAVFACHDRGIWMEFEVPSSAHLVRVEARKSFNLGPLLRAMEQQGTPVPVELEIAKVV
ncbi:MAG TPA: hypothetical protein VHN74_00235 [Candidatus Angelobacter sp.]|jgi:hypothetical protein|nr:hypothetical protein [Candidatus Angelobacter sp.]